MEGPHGDFERRVLLVRLHPLDRLDLDPEDQVSDPDFQS